MGYYPILKTTWKYFPNSKGFLTGLILCVFGLCPMVFTSIADAVINPGGEKIDDDHFFPDYIAKKMSNFALIMAIVMGACGILSQLLMFPLDNVISTDIKKDEDKNNDHNKRFESYASNEIYSGLKENEKNKETEKEQKDNVDEKNNEVGKEENDNKEVNENDEPFKQAFYSWRFHLFNFMSVGTLCKSLYSYNFFL